MKNLIVVLATCLFLAFATQTFAQDCSHGRCNPSRPVAKLAQKLKQSPVMNLQLKFNLDFGLNHRLTYSRFYGDDVLDWSFDETQNYNYDDNTTARVKSRFGIDWPWGNHTNGLTWRWIVSPTIMAKTFLSRSRYRFHFNINSNEEETIEEAEVEIIDEEDKK